MSVWCKCGVARRCGCLCDPSERCQPFTALSPQVYVVCCLSLVHCVVFLRFCCGDLPLYAAFLHFGPFLRAHCLREFSKMVRHAKFHSKAQPLIDYCAVFANFFAEVTTRHCARFCAQLRLYKNVDFMLKILGFHSQFGRALSAQKQNGHFCKKVAPFDPPHKENCASFSSPPTQPLEIQEKNRKSRTQRARLPFSFLFFSIRYKRLFHSTYFTAPRITPPITHF